MKILTLIGVGVATSICFKSLKYGKKILFKNDFDNSVNKFVIKEFAA